ncbi:LuxR C-terminal-related transcriptional regulator [Alicyclobacillus macrosporangiidus]|uniref:RNA polymerase sigma-70 factor, ECF subfamily n=1 Tax=Alicyclobacillus macrosporangiidus TaxID=392015 RepID=A0A1I7J960_9BACL|nr:LuxR C-terminal-related transcriptional regulator [Alicyclobacillus macrosporangiidus]SFU81736.1 RNA polymerase sigma-70 factor, ECF subfamily [Alicyclobacillus macrosporangiidus]
MGRRGLEDLIQQYEETLKKVKEARSTFERLSRTNPRYERDAKLCESMIRTLDYAICKMEGFTRTTHREILVGDLSDLDRMAARRKAGVVDEGSEAEDEGYQRVLVAWSTIMTTREAVCLFAYERGMTFSAIANALGVSRASVQSYVERAREKLRRAQSVQLALWDDTPGLGA